jgi:hypothetical protein
MVDAAESLFQAPIKVGLDLAGAFAVNQATVRSFVEDLVGRAADPRESRRLF